MSVVLVAGVAIAAFGKWNLHTVGELIGDSYKPRRIIICEEDDD